MTDEATVSQIIVMCCVYLPFLNSFNMVILFLYRQRDLRRAAIQGFRMVFCRQEHCIQPATVTGFVR
uniref:Uncharacterized protein n=1 Tax=Setaria digitata TaxID=48799 RepID=A0A915PP79_9BILA